MRRSTIVALLALFGQGCSTATPQAADDGDAGTGTAAGDTGTGASDTDGGAVDSGGDAADTGGGATDATSDAVDGLDGGACGCVEYSDPVTAGVLPVSLDETSGLAASRTNAGVIYAHNDSGDSARVFALSSTGALLGQITLGGATAVDWEDMAVGPCPDGSCVFVADVGDNGKSRSNCAIYTIPEPALDGKPFATQTIAAKKFPFTYPDGKWNCETVLVDPTTGRIYLVTKDSAIDGGVYVFPEKLEPGVPVTLTKVGSAAGTKGALVTGGDISPCGDRVLLRTYGSLLEYVFPPGKTLSDALATKPRNVPVAKEAQGETVAFKADGRGYFTASEGSGVALSGTGCR